jgi:hypothetical protein
MFNYSGKSMWPLCYSIMNLPPSLRDKPHIGEYMFIYDLSCTRLCYVFRSFFMHTWMMSLHVFSCTLC